MVMSHFQPPTSFSQQYHPYLSPQRVEEFPTMEREEFHEPAEDPFPSTGVWGTLQKNENELIKFMSFGKM